MSTAINPIDRILIDGRDEDGQPESFEITITLTDAGYTLEVLQDGDTIDGDTFETLEEAHDAAGDRADDIRKEDRRMARERVRNARQYGRECLLGAAEEMTGEDQDAARLLALLVGAGRGPVALAALQRIATK